MDFQKSFVEHFLENLAEMLGANCEIVVHDFTGGFEQTIVKIINGHVTGRSIGACPTNLFFEKHNDLKNERGDIPVYYNTSGKGQVLKSSTTFIRDETGKITGAVCINYDVTDMITAQHAVNEFINYKWQVTESQQNEKVIYYKNVNEMLEYNLVLVEQMIGKPAAMMDKNEKIKALAFLDKKGVLQIAKAGLKLCEFFCISKYSLYAYLDEGRRLGEDLAVNPK